MSEPVRVLQVFATLNVGGAECRMMDVFHKINRDKIQFDFLSMEDKKQYFEGEITALGGKVIKISNPRKIGIFKNIYEMVRIMRKGDYRVVHAHTSYHCGLVLLAAKIARIKIRIAHARTTGTIQKGVINRIFLCFGKLLIKICATDRLAISKKACVYLFGSECEAKRKATVLPNAINLDSYMDSKIDVDIELKKKLKGKKVIGHIGRFSEMKNQSFLIDVLEYAYKLGFDYMLVLVGDGVLKAMIQEKVHEFGLEDRVIFTGIRRDISSIIGLFDVLVIPSIYEGLGGVVIEAQAAGIPSVVSDALPEEVDIKLGLVNRISLNSPIDEWLKRIECSMGIRVIDKTLIREKFEEKQYTVEQEIKFLSNLYLL